MKKKRVDTLVYVTSCVISHICQSSLPSPVCSVCPPPFLPTASLYSTPLPFTPLQLTQTITIINDNLQLYFLKKLNYLVWENNKGARQEKILFVDILQSAPHPPPPFVCVPDNCPLTLPPYLKIFFSWTYPKKSKKGVNPPFNALQHLRT